MSKKRVIAAERIMQGTPCVMVDLETLAVRSSAVFYEVGAIEFVVSPATGKLTKLRRGQWFIDTKHQVLAGASTDDEVIKWTRGKPDRAKALAKAETSGMSVPQFIGHLGEVVNEDTVLFCNGAAFDAAILDEACHRHNMKTPWSYYNIADLRDFVTAAYLATGKDVFNASREATHDGLDDCHRQIEMLAQCLEEIMRTKLEVVSLG